MRDIYISYPSTSRYRVRVAYFSFPIIEKSKLACIVRYRAARVYSIPVSRYFSNELACLTNVCKGGIEAKCAANLFPPLSLSFLSDFCTCAEWRERERESMCTRVYRPDRVPSGKINVQGLCSGVVAFIRIQAGQACQYPYSVVRIGRIVLTTLRCRRTLSIGFCAHLSRSMYMDREERRRDNWFSIRRTKTRNAKLFLYESVIWGGRNQEYICDIKRLKGGTFSKILISY